MKIVKLVDICTPKQWKTIPTEMLVENGYPVYGANGIIGYYSEYNHEDSVVTITCRGATCGSVNMTCSKAYITGNAMCLDSLDNNIDREYLFYCMKHFDFAKIISGSAQSQITKEGLEKVQIKVYEPNKQKEIVSILKRIENLIIYRKKQLNDLDILIKARFVEMFGDLKNNSKKWKIVNSHLTYFKGFNNCYILLYKYRLSLENTKVFVGVLLVTSCIVLYRFTLVYEPS